MSCKPNTPVANALAERIHDSLATNSAWTGDALPKDSREIALLVHRIEAEIMLPWALHDDPTFKGTVWDHASALNNLLDATRFNVHDAFARLRAMQRAWPKRREG